MIRILTSALLLATATAAFADGDFERTLSVSSRPDLYVSTGSGHIRIRAGSDDQIHIKAHLHVDGWGSRRDDVDARVRRIVAEPPIRQTGNEVRVGEARDRSLYNHIQIDYEISAPAAVALNLRSGSGDIDVDHLGRFLAANTGSGTIRAHGLNGPADLHSGSGDIDLTENGGGDVQADTGSGSIRIHSFTGSLRARTGSGDVEANGRLTGPAHVASGSGSLRLNLSPDARFDLQASTGSGSVRLRFANGPHPASDASHQHLSGPVNGGGPILEAHTGSGDIEINSSFQQ